MGAPLHELLRAAGEPTRLRILNLLRQGSLCVSELQMALGIPQSTVSRHLATLRHAGLATSTRVGTRAVYSLPPADAPFLGALREFIARLCSCEQTLREDLARLQHSVKQRED
jgi:ArsR family transcriptional regulator